MNNAKKMVDDMEIALAEFLRGKMRRLHNSYTLAFEAGWKAKNAANPAEQHQGVNALREDIARSNRIQLAMALDLSAIAQALGIPPEEQQGGAAESIAAIQELHTKLAQLEAAYGPTPGCKQCEEAQECELSSCPECDAEFGPTSAEPSAATREVRHG